MEHCPQQSLHSGSSSGSDNDLCGCADGDNAAAVVALTPKEAAAADGMRRMGVPAAVVNCVAFMATPLLLPSIYARTGLVAGVAFTVFSAGLTLCNGVILGEICARHPHLHSYPLVAEAAFAGFHGSDAARRTRGIVGKRLVQVVQFACYYLTGVAEVIYLQEYLSQLFSGADVCPRTWLLLGAGLAWPFMMIPSFAESRWVATVAMVLMVFNVGVFAVEVFTVAPWANCVGAEPPQGRTTFASTLQGLTGIAYAFGGHGMYPEKLREMADVSRWPSVMVCVYSAITPVYLFMGIAGFAAYGANARANINANYPAGPLNFASIIAQCVQEFYFIFTSAIVLVLQVELSLGISPTVWCAERPAAGARASAGCPPPGSAELSPIFEETRSFEGESSSDEGNADGIGNPAWRLCLRHPWLFRLVFRSAYLGSQVVVALAVTGGEGDALLSLQALAGAVGYVALTYVLPIVFGWVLLPARRPFCVAVLAVSCVACALLGAAGIALNTRELLDIMGKSPASAARVAGGEGCQVNGGDAYLADGCAAALGAGAALAS